VVVAALQVCFCLMCALGAHGPPRMQR
jgi:hypothetical protein